MRINIDDTEDDYSGVLYQGVPFTGEVVEAREDGSLTSLYTYSAGAQDGPYFEW